MGGGGGGARWRHFRGWPARALRSPLQGAIPSGAVRVHDVDAQAPSPTRALRGPRSRPPLPRREAAAGDAILAPNGPERPVVYTRRRRLAHGTQRGGPAGGGATLAPASPSCRSPASGRFEDGRLPALVGPVAAAVLSDTARRTIASSFKLELLLR